mmetsp:Transcript_24121/g.48744  ORF Transcript_24121/g.48744 Transcript_24121/m.48744 type:complete len:279 (+) Transcript_24121:3685-4521(+)
MGRGTLGDWGCGVTILSRGGGQRREGCTVERGANVRMQTIRRSAPRVRPSLRPLTSLCERHLGAQVSQQVVKVHGGAIRTGSTTGKDAGVFQPVSSPGRELLHIPDSACAEGSKHTVPRLAILPGGENDWVILLVGANAAHRATTSALLRLVSRRLPLPLSCPIAVNGRQLIVMQKFNDRLAKWGSGIRFSHRETHLVTPPDQPCKRRDVVVKRVGSKAMLELIKVIAAELVQSPSDFCRRQMLEIVIEFETRLPEGLGVVNPDFVGGWSLSTTLHFG